jgi:bifunctional non-homologous end joining protein LigD
MGLQRYREKRHFTVTPEPKGGKRSKTGFSYVIQKHDASHLHYDFRLELDGVLLSWAVPKGPSLDPKVRRLAMQVEDHPIDYATFEGTIPEGEYGGGTVMVWDAGTWEPLDDPKVGRAKGHLRFALHGKKLRGVWHLVRTGKGDEKKQGWLLFKSRDEEARSDRSIVDEQPTSAKTGRTMEQIARANNSVWHSNRAAKTATGRKARTTETRNGAPSIATKRAPPAARVDAAIEEVVKRGERVALPGTVEPQRPVLVKQVPEGPAWGHELKYDGYRILARLENGAVTLSSRNGHDWTHKVPGIVEAIANQPFATALFDGEIVVQRPDGTTDFQLLQNALRADADHEITYFVFDLLYLNGRSLQSLPLRDRKSVLERVLAKNSNPRVHFSRHLESSGEDFFRAACKLHAEGIVSKKLDEPYRPGKGRDWLKTKCLGRQEFVVGGFTDPSGSRSHFGALLLGVRTDRKAKGKLTYAGKVGTGFSRQSLAEVSAKLKPLVSSQSPFASVPRAEAKSAHWLRPKLVAEVEFTEMTQDGLLRHPSFRGLRSDKPAREVTLEVPQDTPAQKPQKQNQGPHQRLTHPERVLYPKDGITKQELAEYYAAVSPWMMPHVANRPLTLVRCPQGVGKQRFFQKHAKPPLPPSIRAIPIEDDGKIDRYMAIDGEEGLLSLTQMSVLEIHTWGAHADDPEKPDFLVFDLDPDPAVKWGDVIACATLLRKGLAELGLQSYVKTTGGKGLHICLPITRRVSWDDAKEFCRGFTEMIVRVKPDAYVATMSKAQRVGKIFIDFFRNGRGATFIAPYSTRARDGAAVAMPLAWDELSLKLRADHFNVRNVMKRMAKLSEDPWLGASSQKQTLSAAALRAVAH